MEEIILNTDIKLNIFELLSYFSIEIMCIFGMIINFIISLFIVKKINLKRLSNVMTAGVFFLNSAILTIFLFKGTYFFLWDNFLIFSPDTVFLKLFINLFALFFVITTYKYTAKFRYKVPMLNAILMLIVMLCGILLSSDNFTLIYVILEFIVILLYKYSSISRLTSGSVYSLTYITISFCATCLFVVFYVVDYFVQDLLQKSIMQSCMACALLMKTGLFPVFNYSLDKKCRTHISYVILLFCILPFVGAVAFNKIMSLCMYNEVCQLSVSAVVILCALFASLAAFKIKNLTGFLIYTTQVYICLYILNSIVTKSINPQFIIIALFTVLLLYSALRIYKNKKRNTILFSCLLTFYALLIPLFAKDILYNIYTYDKTGFFALNIFVFCNIVIIIKTLKIIESFYGTKCKS